MANYADNYSQTWDIRSACAEVRVVSTCSSCYFYTEYDYDFVFVDDRKYSGDTSLYTSTMVDASVDSGYLYGEIYGDSGVIDQVVGKDFMVTFESDSTTSGFGFRIQWSCYSSLTSFTTTTTTSTTTTMTTTIITSN